MYKFFIFLFLLLFLRPKASKVLFFFENSSKARGFLWYLFIFFFRRISQDRSGPGDFFYENFCREAVKILRLWKWVIFNDDTFKKIWPLWKLLKQWKYLIRTHICTPILKIHAECQSCSGGVYRRLLLTEARKWSITEFRNWKFHAYKVRTYRPSFYYLNVICPLGRQWPVDIGWYSMSSIVFAG